jgi:hypothetical protein
VILAAGAANAAETRMEAERTTTPARLTGQ